MKYSIQFSNDYLFENEKKDLTMDQTSNWRKALSKFVRTYIRYSPIPFGKGILYRAVIIPLLTKHGQTFLAETPNGGKYKVTYRSEIGKSVFLKSRFFEEAEIRFVSSIKFKGDVYDVGGNIGIYSVALGKVLPQKFLITSFEPIAENVKALEENVRFNKIPNSRIIASAVGNQEGTISFHLSSDPAYSSASKVIQFVSDKSITVPITSLDAVWKSDGKPPISLIKIDVEGAEEDVLKGARELIKSCYPIMLIEANSASHLQTLKLILLPYGYAVSQPTGFEPWNYIFSHPNSDTH